MITGQHPGYRSWESAGSALFTSMARRGWLWPQVHTEMSQPNILARTWFATPDVMLKWWMVAEDFVRGNPIPETAPERAQIVGEIRAAYRASTAPMLTTRRDVLECLHQFATERHSDIISLSTRDVYIRAAVSQMTAVRSLHDLIEWHWLVRIHRGNKSEAGVYRLSKPTPNQLCQKDSPLRRRVSRGVQRESFCQTSGAADLAANDVFAQTARETKPGSPGKGLGRAAARVYCAIQVGNCTPADIAAVTDMSLRTVQRQLKILCDEHLAIRSAYGQYIHTEVADWEAVAALMGTAGQAAERVDFVAERRSLWAAAKAERAAQAVKPLATVHDLSNKRNEASASASASPRTDSYEVAA